jgi:hypothetical protein
LLGLWIGAGLWMALVSALTLRTVDYAVLIASSSSDSQLRTLGPGATTFLHDVALQQKMLEMRQWEKAQLVLGALVFLYLLLGTRLGWVPIAAVLLMTGITAGQHYLAIPQLQYVAARLFDTANSTSRANVQRGFWMGHKVYLAAEAFKLGVGVTVVLWLAFSKRRRESDRSGDQIDLVDKANHGHINR